MLSSFISVDQFCNALVSHVAHQGVQIATTCAGLSALLWTGAGVFFCMPRARRALCSLVLSADLQPGAEAMAGRVALGATALSVLGAGTSFGLAVYAHRNWIAVQRTAPSMKDAVEAAVTNALGPDTTEAHSAL